MTSSHRPSGGLVVYGRHMTRVPITAPEAAAVGPYSHGVEYRQLVFVSGQTPIDPATGKLVGGGIDVQTRQCFKNLFAVLAAADLGPDDVLQCKVYLTDMSDFDAMNRVYAQQFDEPYPSRTTIGVAALPLGAAVEIELIARRPDIS